MDTLTIRRVALDTLVPDPANPRTHDERNVAAIRASLQRFGQSEPLVVQTGTNRIIAGHGRLEAMRALGWTEVDVVDVDLDDTQATALAIALNRTGELATWDDRALSALLQSLGDTTGTGFDASELDALIAEIAAEDAPAGVDDPGPSEPPEVPVTQRGDLWLLGDHRLLCGDSTSAEDVTRLMNGEIAKLWSSDPPYCVNYTGNDRPIHDGKSSGKDWSHVYREVDIADLGQFLDGVFTATLPHVVEDSPIYCWHAHVQQPVIAATFERHGLLLHQVLVWVKPCAVFGHSYFRWRHEPCAFGWRKGNKPSHGVGQLDTVWEADWDGKARHTTFHPCLHPDALVLTEKGYRPIRSISIGDRVLAADGVFHAVTHISTHAYTSENLYRISAEDSEESTLASDNHPFLIWRPSHEGASVADGVVDWIRADEIKLGDYTMTPVVAETAAAAFSRIEHEGRAYALRRVEAVDLVPYVGDVWNLSVDDCPTFQTAVGMSHNTSKPTKLFETPIELHTKPGEIIIEPFNGSGSQIIAATKLARRCYAMELQPAFVDGTIDRWQKATGKLATLEATGQTFAEVEADRATQS